MVGELKLLELENGIKFWTRPGSNDHNTVWSCAWEDEYGLADVEVEGKLVFDIGAYIGGVGVWLATRGARVVCVEPIPGNVELIQLNAALNNASLEILEAVVGRPGVQTVRWGFYADPEWNARVDADPTCGLKHDEARIESIRHHQNVGMAGLILGNPVDQIYEEAVVESYSLHDLVGMYGAPDIIKLDCEGGEWALFNEPEIRVVPLITGEWHAWDNQPDTPTTGTRVEEDVVSSLGGTHELLLSQAAPGGPIRCGGFRATLK